MTVFIDTSALYASIDGADEAHVEAADTFRSFRGRDLVTHNYVVIESVALVQRRLGIGAVRDLVDGLLRPARVAWIDRDLHNAALASLLASGRRGISLVDHVSFELMRREGITTVFAIDSDFDAAGFETLP